MKLSTKKGVIVIILLLGWAFILRPPVNGGMVTSMYGFRVTGDRTFHTGTDIALPIGTPVTATSWGIVKETGFHDRNGNYVKISHLPGIESRYLHLDSCYVTVRQEVTPLSLIGRVGNTGLSTGSHLHFEIRVFGIPLPPYILCLPGRIIQKINGYKIIHSSLP